MTTARERARAAKRRIDERAARDRAKRDNPAPAPSKSLHKSAAEGHAANVFQVATMSPNMDPESVVAQLRKEHSKSTLRYMIAARDPLHAVLVELERQLEETE